jgi:hypothetical protein
MRSMVTIERTRSAPSAYLVAGDAMSVLGEMPGVSAVTLEHENLSRATISFIWKDPGMHSASMDLVLANEGMRIVR